MIPLKRHQRIQQCQIDDRIRDQGRHERKQKNRRLDYSKSILQ